MNKKLVISIILLLFFMIISLFGSWIAPYDKDFHEVVVYENGKISAPPSSPSAKYPLGTDNYGQDILSLLLYGAKYTVFSAIIISLLRVLTGSLVGMFLGIKTKKKKKTLINSATFGSIPTFLIVYFLLLPINIQTESTEVSIKLILITLTVFSIVGIPSVVSTIREKTEEIMKKEFVSSAIILGANSRRLMFRHIYPQMLESLIILFVTEIVLVLAVYGQLGLFNFFIGGTVMYINPTIFDTITGEWAGLIGQARMYIYTNEWIVLSPMIAYILLIFSFQLLSNGLNDYFKKKLHNYPYL